MKFKRRPLLVDAMQFNCPATEEFKKFVGDFGLGKTFSARHNYLIYHGPEISRVVQDTNWLVRNHNGNFDIWTDDHFKRMFEAIEDEPKKIKSVEKVSAQ